MSRAVEIQQRLLNQVQDEHYSKWPYTPLPALDGQTPREAIRIAAGKQRVIDLLKMFENEEEHNRREGEAWYDFAKLRASLGIEL